VSGSDATFQKLVPDTGSDPGSKEEIMTPSSTGARHAQNDTISVAVPGGYRDVDVHGLDTGEREFLQKLAVFLEEHRKKGTPAADRFGVTFNRPNEEHIRNIAGLEKDEVLKYEPHLNGTQRGLRQPKVSIQKRNETHCYCQEWDENWQCVAMVCK
jgi:hypothetical protein